jgi:hypothetical protein
MGRALLTLFLVFGSVAVIYIVHWSKRAASAVDDASKIFLEKGSIRETAKQLYREQMTPDAVRLSRRQVEFINTNLNEFQTLYGAAIFAAADDALQGWKLAHPSANAAQTRQATDKIVEIISMRHAKLYCSAKGVI